MSLKDTVDLNRNSYINLKCSVDKEDSIKLTNFIKKLLSTCRYCEENAKFNNRNKK